MSPVKVGLFNLQNRIQSKFKTYSNINSYYCLSHSAEGERGEHNVSSKIPFAILTFKKLGGFFNTMQIQEPLPFLRYPLRHQQSLFPALNPYQSYPNLNFNRNFVENWVSLPVFGLPLGSDVIFIPKLWIHPPDTTIGRVLTQPVNTDVGITFGYLLLNISGM